MSQEFLSEYGTLLGGVAAAAFALARMSMSQQKTLVERFMTFMESALSRQEQTIERFADSIDRLNQNLESSNRKTARGTAKASAKSTKNATVQMRENDAAETAKVGQSHDH